MNNVHFKTHGLFMLFIPENYDLNPHPIFLAIFFAHVLSACDCLEAASIVEQHKVIPLRWFEFHRKLVHSAVYRAVIIVLGQAGNFNELYRDSLDSPVIYFFRVQNTLELNKGIWKSEWLPDFPFVHFIKFLIPPLHKAQVKQNLATLHQFRVVFRPITLILEWFTP